MNENEPTVSAMLQEVYGPAIMADLTRQAKLMRALDPRTDEELERDRADYKVLQAKEASKYSVLLESSSGLSREILTLHARDEYGYCLHDEQPWPCETANPCTLR